MKNMEIVIDRTILISHKYITVTRYGSYIDLTRMVHCTFVGSFVRSFITLNVNCTATAKVSRVQKICSHFDETILSLIRYKTGCCFGNFYQIEIYRPVTSTDVQFARKHLHVYKISQKKTTTTKPYST